MPHVPKTDTHFIENISFETVLEAAMLPSAEYDVSKWLFVPNIYTEYRYILGTRGSRPLICIGVNPSTAAPDRLDPTMQSVQRIALQNGYDSFVMCNVYAQRATSPKDMDRKCNGKLHQENLRAFMCALSLYDKPSIWAAWGNIIETRSYLSDCLRDMVDISLARNAAWYHCGAISRKGHPHHPLYLRKGEPLMPFDIQRYLSIITGRDKRP